MSKEISKQLAKCPFCGETLRKIGSKHRGNQFYVHDLNGPDCILKEFAFKADDEEKIKHWNTRKPLERIVERLEILYDEAQDKLSDNFIYYDGRGDGVDMAMRVVKEEGGMNE